MEVGRGSGTMRVRRPGNVVDILFFDVMSQPHFLNARCAISVVQVPVVQGVVRTPVVLIARCGGRDRVLGVVPIKARYAERDRVPV